MRRGVYLRDGRSYLSGRARTGTREADVIVCPPPGPDFFAFAGKGKFGYSLGKFMENKPENFESKSEIKRPSEKG